MPLPLPSRGLLKGKTVKFTSPPVYLASHETSAPPGKTIPASDPLAILHTLKARRLADKQEFEEQAKDNSKKRKTARGNSETEKGGRSSASSTPFGLSSGQSAAPAGPESSDRNIYGRMFYTADALQGKSLSELKLICQTRGLPVSGKKQVLADRVLKSQLGPFPNVTAA